MFWLIKNKEVYMAKNDTKIISINHMKDASIVPIMKIHACGYIYGIKSSKAAKYELFS